MKNILLLPFCCFASFSFSQNSTPDIEISSVEVDEIAQTVSVSYQLQDADSDPCDVWLKVSTDGGEFFEIVPETSLSGDVGDAVAPSSALTLVWDYSEITEAIIDVRLQVYASDNQAVSIADMVAQVDEAELLSTLEAIIGVRHYTANPGHLEEVRGYLNTAFSDAGLQTEDHDFTFDATSMRNVIGRKPGAKNEAITYVIDGHFDGVPGSPGADDNGSAVAGVLEALRILSQYDFEHSIRFVGFDAEELGLIGSLRYVQNGIKPFEEIAGVLNYEMIGYYSDQPGSQSLPFGFNQLFPAAAQAIADDDNRGNFITVVGNVDSNPLISAFAEASETYVPDLRVISVAVPGTGTIAPDLRRSDHASFWDGGFQALMLTDGANFRNFNYHTPNDIISTLNFEFMANVVKATLATAAELAIPISVDSDELDLSTILSVEDHNHGFPGKLNIFPNPTNGILSIQIAEAAQDFRARLEVFELSGKAVHKEVLNFSSGTSTSEIDLQRLSDGPYILVLHTEDTSVSRSFVIGR
jgi:hypothetical protein